MKNKETEKLFKLAYTDAMTGVYNRNAYEETLEKLKTKGYVPTSSEVRFIVAWKPKDAPKEEKEHAVMLLDLTMSRDSHTRKTT